MFIKIVDLQEIVTNTTITLHTQDISFIKFPTNLEYLSVKEKCT